MKKTYWILIILGAILLPLGLNGLILQPKWFDVVGDGSDWLSFWGTYISAIASIAMVIATFITLRQNRKQVDELRRQWEEQNRARLQFSIIAKETLYLLKISNVGKSAAFGINLNHNELLFDHIDEDLKRFYPTSAFALEAGKSQYLPICGRSEGDKESFMKKCKELHLQGSYCNTYIIDETIITSEYMQFEKDPNYDAIVVELTDFKEKVTTNINKPMPIQKSLDMIAKKIEKIKIEDNDTK